MEGEKSKFNPEFNFLEDSRILDLDNMVNEIISSEVNQKDKVKLFKKIESQWDKVQKECVENRGNDNIRIKNFLRFVSYNLRKISAGGINLGRSRIGDFIEQKAKEMIPYFEEFPID